MGLFGSNSSSRVVSSDEAALAALPKPTQRAARNLTELQSTGRYMALPKPNGGVVHVVGVVPGAKLSEAEVELVLNQTSPQSVYLDLVHEQIEQLRADMLSTSDGRPTTPNPEWPKLAWTVDKGFDIALEERVAKASNDLLLLCGADYFGPWRTALKWLSSNNLAPPEILSYPFPWTGRYKDGRAPCKRVVRTAVDVAGTTDMSQSTTNIVAVNTHPPLPRPLMKLELSLPPDGAFNQPQVRTLRRVVSNALSAAAQGATAQSMDGEEVLARALELEKTKVDKGGDGSVWALESVLQLLDLDRAQSRAVAYTLKSAPGDSTVAVVDLARMGGLQRQWDNELAPEQVFPPRRPVDFALRTALVVAPLALLGVAARRSFRRFPRVTGVAAGLAALAGVGQWWQLNNFEYLTVGNYVRGSLARPIAPMGSGVVAASQLARGDDVARYINLQVDSGMGPGDAAAHTAALAAAAGQSMDSQVAPIAAPIEPVAEAPATTERQ